ARRSVGRSSVTLRLRGEDPDPFFGQSGRRWRPGHVRPPPDSRPPRAEAGRRGRADRGRPAAGVRRSDLPAPAADPPKSAFKTVDWVAPVAPGGHDAYLSRHMALLPTE